MAKYLAGRKGLITVDTRHTVSELEVQYTSRARADLH